MRVLHVYKTYMPYTVGGVETVINEIASNTNHMGISNHILCANSGTEDSNKVFKGYRVSTCKSSLTIANTPFSYSMISKFRELSRESDIIHYHFPYPFMDLLHLLHSVNKPSIVTYHSDIIKQKYLLNIYRPLMFKFLNSVDRIVATSPNYVKSSRVLSKFLNKVDVIPIGINKSNYPAPKDNIISSWEKKLGKNFFLFIGVLRYYKGLEDLIMAAKSSRHDIVIAGIGPMEKELKNKVEINGIKNVTFIGLISDSDKIALISLSCAIIFPSNIRSEAFGVFLLEGAMHGKPLISTDIGTGTSYVNIHNETGIVVRPNRPDELHNAMSFLKDNPGQLERMGKNAQRRYESSFTTNKMATSYFELYKRLTSKN